MLSKKIILLFSMMFLLAGCTVKDDLDIYDNTTNIPQTTPTTQDTDIDDGDLPQGLTGVNNDQSMTSIQNINNRLDESLTTMNGKRVGVDEEGYLTGERDYYTNTSTAYKQAYDDFTALRLSGDQKAYYAAISDYYKHGYDTYNNLSSKYKGFKTSEEENLYRTGVGKTSYELKQDLKNSYQDALDNLGIDFTDNSR